MNAPPASAAIVIRRWKRGALSRKHGNILTKEKRDGKKQVDWVPAYSGAIEDARGASFAPPSISKLGGLFGRTIDGASATSWTPDHLSSGPLDLRWLRLHVDLRA